MRLALAAAMVATGTASYAQVGVSFDAKSGTYQISDAKTGYRLSGSIGQQPSAVVTSRDRSYTEIRFRWNPGSPVEGAIRWTPNSSTVWFRVRYFQGASGSGTVFPNFSTLPTGLKSFSFKDDVFAPPTFGLAETSTPWLFFDGQAHSFILSPSSEFMVAKMVGDGKGSIGVGLGEHVSSVPAGFVQESLLCFGDGINQTWDGWGTALRARYSRRLPEQKSDRLLEKFGYWTDNGADYYYNYDLNRGYANTLLDLKQRYESEAIPLAYLQLDSWWYQKTINDADGRPGSSTKNSKLPEGSWNRYGGTYEYRAHPDLFPKGLSAFDETLGIPLAVHSRWIDRTSPYTRDYKISGVGAVDPRWWKDTVGYLKSAGVICYEQDWLDHIYQYSPEMSEKVGVADQFTDGMANACRAGGLSMQYCMATPRFFLQGVKYPNLTTIRTSGDRFERGKWTSFLYASKLAQEAGIWPWCDVFKSGETGNLILSVLSAGPVGTGDRIGKENKENLFRAIRSDGVIVKPDRSLVPTDQTFLDEATAARIPLSRRPSPTIPALEPNTCSRSRVLRALLRCFFTPRMGVSGRSYLLDMATQQGRFVEADEPVQQELTPRELRILMLAPVSKCGIVLLGDLSKIVPTGKQRISSWRIGQTD